jgi:hypothetical protein
MWCTKIRLTFGKSLTGLYFSINSWFLFSSSSRLETGTKNIPYTGTKNTHQKLVKLPITRLEPIFANQYAIIN